MPRLRYKTHRCPEKVILMRLDSLSSVQFKEVMTKKPVILLPIGATEAHGGHLPLCTDSVQPEYVADKVAEQICGLVAPPIRYAHHSSTKNMPGTISISFLTTMHIAIDVLNSLIDNGADKIVIVSGHAGSSHLNALRQGCAEVAEKRDVKIMLLSDYDLVDEFPIDQIGDGHGGKVETSRVMHICPDLARKAPCRGDYVSCGYLIVSDPERCMPKGYVGDAQDASRELGEQINEFVVSRLVEEIKKSFGGFYE